MMMMMMMMMMSVVICDEIYRILFKNNFLPSLFVFSAGGPFSRFSNTSFSCFLREGKKDLLLGPKGEERISAFSPFFFPFCGRGRGE